METKLIKRTTKSIKRHHRNYQRRLRRSQIHQPRCIPTRAAAAAATSVIASINKSIYKCHRRLLRIFSHLSHLDGGGCQSTKGFKILKNHHHPDPKTLTFKNLFSLIDEKDERLDAEKTKKEKKTIVLDLDETLVHSTMERPEGPYDFVVRPRIDGQILTFFVIKRPGLDEFLRKIGEKYEVVVFTAGLREYASLVVDRLDPGRRVISHCLYRDACREVDGKLVKDLGRVEADMGRVAIVDDNPNSYALQPENAVPIKPFLDDRTDEELRKLGEFFDGCNVFEDMRVAVKEFLGRGIMI